MCLYVHQRTEGWSRSLLSVCLLAYIKTGVKETKGSAAPLEVCKFQGLLLGIIIIVTIIILDQCYNRLQPLGLARIVNSLQVSVYLFSFSVHADIPP